jgi:ribonuclease HI
MHQSEVLTINIDGASRGNPGPAAFAYVIRREGAPVTEEAGCLPPTTNNFAEYTALVRALERATKLGAKRLHINSDSELLVKQMNGEYRVKHPELRILYERAKKLIEPFKQVTIVHVPREENRRADELCNEALDGKHKSKEVADTARKERPQNANSPLQESASEEALICLRAAARAWSLGDPEVPSPGQVLEQICSILEENGLLRSRRLC